MISYDDMGIPDISQLDFSEADEQHYIVDTALLDADDFVMPDFWCDHAGQQCADDFDPAMLLAIRGDPQLAPQLQVLYAHAHRQFSSLIDQAAAVLPKESVMPATTILDGGAVSGRKLMTGSRKVELAVKSRRELAEAFAFECVLNLGNPDWNPADPATSKDSPSALLALLR